MGVLTVVCIDAAACRAQADPRRGSLLLRRQMETRDHQSRGYVPYSIVGTGVPYSTLGTGVPYSIVGTGHVIQHAAVEARTLSVAVACATDSMYYIDTMAVAVDPSVSVQHSHAVVADTAHSCCCCCLLLLHTLALYCCLLVGGGGVYIPLLLAAAC